ncbi:hypothetical protein CRYPD_695 [uncultured Candidatus Thioglobus sp.]|nr:hypothetical protein CRYPD_695 [uncultured Candidatus Thioglobus sp.]
MKKQLMIVAVATTMATATMADISITGNAYFTYSDNAIGGNVNDDDQRIKLKVIGSTGTTKVVAVIRNGSKTRVDSDAVNNDGNKGLHMDSLYITTKAGPVNIKAGDYSGTIGHGVRSMGADKKNALALSTSISGVKLGIFTHNGSGIGSESGSDSTNVSVSTKISSTTVGIVHNPDNFTDISVEGDFGGVSVAAEQWIDKEGDNNATLIQVNGKVAGFNWGAIQVKNDVPYVAEVKNTSGVVTTAGQGVSNGDFAPLGSMLIGTGNRGGKASSAKDVGDFTKVLGVSVSTKFEGSTVKAIYTKNTLGTNDKVTGTELILTRPLNGAKLTLNVGKFSDSNDATLNNSNKGIRLDVNF